MVLPRSYIPIFFTFIFLVKFIAIDTNAVSLLFKGSETTFVNPYCKKKNSPKQTGQTKNLTKSETETYTILILSGFCASPLQVTFNNWETSLDMSTPVPPEESPSALMYRYSDNDSPPPRMG